ncbi:MAG: glycerophosphodiester phosphodiesterase [Chloroflexi bacterium]|nr:glycerophosphodiester phosphodiesterase [Chloroflexota bacterium]MBP8058839.1 glycerophosphodiester phosphodiesterase [Chloroflexota bacterium]
MGKKVAQIGVGFLGAFLLVYLILALIAQPIPDHPYFATAPHVLVIAHQGGEQLRPDNTLAAFQHAAELGVDVLEMDIHSTADGHLVVIHDDSVDRTTNGTGRITELTLAEIKTFDAAYRWPHNVENPTEFPYRGQGITIPTLAEIFQTFPEYRINIEIKQTEPPLAEPLCQLIREYHKEEQVLVVASDAAAIQAFREQCPEVATGGAAAEIQLFFGLNTVFLGATYQPRMEAFQVPEYSGNIHVVTDRFVQEAHQQNVQVHVWTIDEEADMRRFIALGVDGIITNRPDLLLQLLGR